MSMAPSHSHSPPKSHSNIVSKPPEIPVSFTKRKNTLLASLSESSTDKSPKGSVDSQIVDLITEINNYDGLVTTSSCAGRISVFVEGPRTDRHAAPEQDVKQTDDEEGEQKFRNGDGGGEVRIATSRRAERKGTKGNIGGKGGGQWAYVSHQPVQARLKEDATSGLRSGVEHYFTNLFRLTPRPEMSGTTPSAAQTPRLIRLAFEPFILHVQCASLAHARPLLSAAIASGFRESGVQSLKNLTDPEAWPMIGVRTAGLGFESVVGIVEEISEGLRVDHGDGGAAEVYRALVDESYLKMCMEVCNTRFEENGRRSERFRVALREAWKRDEVLCGLERQWEDKGSRRQRLRKEGLERRRDKKKKQEFRGQEADSEQIQLDGELLDLLPG